MRFRFLQNNIFGRTAAVAPTLRPWLTVQIQNEMQSEIIDRRIIEIQI